MLFLWWKFDKFEKPTMSLAVSEEELTEEFEMFGDQLENPDVIEKRKCHTFCSNLSFFLSIDTESIKFRSSSQVWWVAKF